MDETFKKIFLVSYISFVLLSLIGVISNTFSLMMTLYLGETFFAAYTFTHSLTSAFFICLLIVNSIVLRLYKERGFISLKILSLSLSALRLVGFIVLIVFTCYQSNFIQNIISSFTGGNINSIIQAVIVLLLILISIVGTVFEWLYVFTLSPNKDDQCLLDNSKMNMIADYLAIGVFIFGLIVGLVYNNGLIVYPSTLFILSGIVLSKIVSKIFKNKETQLSLSMIVLFITLVLRIAFMASVELVVPQGQMHQPTYVFLFITQILLGVASIVLLIISSIKSIIKK